MGLPPSRQVPDHETQVFSARQRDYCVCIPVINEGDRIQNQLRTMHALDIPAIADILICDGGSSDGSLEPEFLQALGVRALLVKIGPGKLSAQLRMGYAYALDEGYRGIVTIDGNDKDDPAPIRDFVAALQNGVDFVQASRFIEGGAGVRTPLSRLLAIRLIHAPLISLGAGFWFTDTTQGFRAYSRRVLEDPRVAPFRDVFDSYELLAYLSVRIPRLGYKTVELPTKREYPATGKTPTKIGGWRGNVKLMRTLFAAITGRYNP